MNVDISKLQINQNVIVLIIGLAGLGISEYYNLQLLRFFSFFISIIMSISVVFSMSYYSLHYIQKKNNGASNIFRKSKVSPTEKIALKHFEYTHVTNQLSYFSASLALIIGIFTYVNNDLKYPNRDLVILASGVIIFIISIYLLILLSQQSKFVKEIISRSIDE